jgi:hypothetical protein
MAKSSSLMHVIWKLSYWHPGQYGFIEIISSLTMCISLLANGNMILEISFSFVYIEPSLILWRT